MLQAGLLIDKNTAKRKVLENAKRKHFVFNGPTLHIIIPTARCNQGCSYCHSSVKPPSEKGVDLEPETGKKIIDFIIDTKPKDMTIEFNGGESSLKTETLRELIEYCEEKKGDKNIEYLLVSKVTTSLDGPSKVHNINRPLLGGIESHSKVTKNMKELKEKGVEVNALMVTTKRSLRKYVEIINEYVLRDLKMIHLKHLNNIGYAKGKSKISYSAEEFIVFWRKSLDYILELNKRGVRIIERITEVILQKIITGIDPNYFEMRNPCGMILGQIAYNYDGKIYTCDEGKGNDLFEIGDVRKDRLRDILARNKTKALLKMSYNENLICNSCAYQPYCGICPVLAHAEQNNLIPKVTTTMNCKVYMNAFNYVFEKMIFNNDERNILMNWIN